MIMSNLDILKQRKEKALKYMVNYISENYSVFEEFAEKESGGIDLNEKIYSLMKNLFDEIFLQYAGLPQTPKTCSWKEFPKDLSMKLGLRNLSIVPQKENVVSYTFDLTDNGKKFVENFFDL